MNWTSGTKPRKYRNVPTEYDGRKYDSKAEAAQAAQLDLEKKSGQIRGWLPQVSFALPGLTRRMVVDFLVVMPDGRIRLQDVKGGIITRDWQIKRELLEKALGLPVDIVRRMRR